MGHMKKIVLASGNQGKLAELQQLLDSQHIEVIAQSAFNVTEAPETGLSFVENAIIKARNACEQTGLPAIADDSGLEVDALNGQPGIYSARFAGNNASDDDNNQKLLSELAPYIHPQRSARFRCVLVLMTHKYDPSPAIFEGSWEGQILFEPAGSNGFGYDPLFYVPDRCCSSAELTPGIKNRISHRGQAMAKLLDYWRIQSATA